MTNWTDRLFVARAGTLQIPCRACGRTMYIPPSQANQRATCNATCAAAAPPKPRVWVSGPSTPWHLRLKEARGTAVEKTCDVCQGPFWVPPSKAADWHTCSTECAIARRQRGVISRQRPCETCGTVFSPRQVQVNAGWGRFCSQACNTAAREVITRPDTLVKAQARKREVIAAGLLKYPKGADNKQWMGGPEACRSRRRESGKEAAGLRAYRKANPHKVKEFSQRRHGRKTGRLPRGTAKLIYEAQRAKCAICRTSIKRGYHLDHITPLAKGGEHAPRNLQLLCATCNVRKNARDPIDYMRSLGRLL